MNLPRILILDTSPIRRGAQIFVEELADHLFSIGYKVKRVYLFSPIEIQTISIGNQDKILPFFEDSILEKFPTFQPTILIRLRNEIESFKPQIILCNGSKTLKYGAWLKVFGLSGKSILVGRFIDDAIFWNEKGVKKWAYSYWLSRLDGMVSVSQTSSDSMIQHYHFQKPNTVIHRVFDPRKFQNAPSREEARKLLGIADQDEVLLLLGNLTAQKRPDRFIEIVSQLTKSRPRLKGLIVGDGNLRGELERLIQFKLPKAVVVKDSSVSRLRSSISFTGYQQNVSPYLAAADLLILTSDTEGLPGVVLEAAHFAVPTVSTEVGGIKECLIDGETGILIPDRSVSDFCEKINFLLDQPETRNTMGNKAKTFISQNFRMDHVADQYLEFFQSIIAKS